MKSMVDAIEEYEKINGKMEQEVKEIALHISKVFQSGYQKGFDNGLKARGDENE